MARIDETLRAARARTESGDAEWLLAHVLGQSRGWLYAHGDDELDAAAQARFAQLLARRIAGEPVAYLVGRRGFWCFDLKVTPATLIPRPETELLVELALARLPADRVADIADLGTGSGAIALALAHERPQARVIATDASVAALEVAEGNARELRLENIVFLQGDWLAPLKSKLLQGRGFDLIVSNPPYIAATDAHLDQGDLRFEPPGALASGVDGLDAMRTIVRDAPAHLAAGGWLLLEHGWDQGEAVRALLIRAGLADVGTARDLEERDRISFGRLGVAVGNAAGTRDAG
ncbi:MAG: peptide chain release factor N(5)-glutamine methyltransferase [Lysobacter sp.]